MTALSRHCAFLRLWGMPLLLAVLSLGGLVAALLGTGLVWKALAWLGLGIPMAVMAGFVWPRKRR